MKKSSLASSALLLALLPACQAELDAELPDVDLSIDFGGVAQAVPPPDTKDVPPNAPFVIFADDNYGDVTFKVEATTASGTEDITDATVVTSVTSGAGKPIFVVAPLGGFPPGATINVSITGEIERQFTFTTGEAAPAEQTGNYGFEDGVGAGWVGLGDVAAVEATGSLAPSEGDRMLAMTTGEALGGRAIADTSSFIVSGFIDAADATSLRFDYNFQSSEFDDFCNSAYDDTFLLVVTGEKGSVTKVVETVNLTCARADHTPAELPALPDGGDADYKQTGVRSFSVDISTAELGERLSISFVLTDVGDTILSSAVGIDGIAFE